MREIKFRAWDKTDKIMVQVMEMCFHQWWLQVSLDDSEENYKGYGERHSFSNQETDRFVLMQYTGLKDKNGKEIYEGDFLDCGGFNRVVEFHPSCFFGVYGDDWVELYSHNYMDSEVVGNIHENPELLTKSKTSAL